jgi:hypothetical protein
VTVAWPRLTSRLMSETVLVPGPTMAQNRGAEMGSLAYPNSATTFGIYVF